MTSEDVELLWVKGSGGDLGTLRPGGLAVLRLDRLRALVSVYPGVDREDEMVAAFDFCLHGKGGAAPSIDTAMHGLVDARVLKWADQIGEALAVPIKMFPRLRGAGEVAGPTLPDLGRPCSKLGETLS